jgi:hypothetical protein
MLVRYGQQLQKYFLDDELFFYYLLNPQMLVGLLLHELNDDLYIQGMFHLLVGEQDVGAKFYQKEFWA